MKSIYVMAAIAFATIVIACGERAAEPTAEQRPIPAAEASAAQDKSPADISSVETNPTAIITSVHAQWIISDSMPKAEITLIGQNLALNATVTSNSPQISVENIDSDPGRTLVIVAMDRGSPPGNYDFQYHAPGQEPILFTIRYEGTK